MDNISKRRNRGLLKSKQIKNAEEALRAFGIARWSTETSVKEAEYVGKGFHPAGDL